MELKILSLQQLPAWLNMRRSVIKEVFGSDDGEFLQNILTANRRYFEENVPAGRHIALFACENGEICGCGDICLHDELPSPDNLSGRCAYLMNIYVVPSRRGENIGRAIVERLIAVAKERNIGKIYLETTETARSFYRKSGFERIKNFLHLEV